MRARRLIAIGSAALVSLALVGCGGSSRHGIAARTPDAIVAEAMRAVDGVHSLRVTGAIDDGSHANRIRLDLRLVNGRGATGELSEHGLAFRLVSVGGVAYVNGSAGFWSQFGGPAAVSRLHGRWLRAPADHGDFASFQSLTDVHRLLKDLLAGHGALTRGNESVVDGVKVIAVHDVADDGTLFVAATGTPYPIRIADGSAVGARIDFSEFNRPVALRPPTASVDIASLQG